MVRDDTTDINDKILKEDTLNSGEEIVNETVKFFEDTMYEVVFENRTEINEFLAMQEQQWGKCFIAFEAMYIMTVKAAEQYSKFALKNEEYNEKKYLFISLQNIHGRACQIYLEILCLMKNGFADGAYARWRSMYELSVIAYFISKYGEVVAKSFLESANTNDQYEWARKASCFKSFHKEYVRFADIHRTCKFEKKVWKTQYDLANKIIHATPQGTFKRLANKDNGGNTIVGPSNYGLTTPAEHSAISLAMISNVFMSIFPNRNSIIAIQYINRWIDVIRKYFFSTHDEAFEENKFSEYFKEIEKEEVQQWMRN